jgi:histidinol-phosphate/aromatic aminotransferase/cobyric acid decarboxylase-like protein
MIDGHGDDRWKYPAAMRADFSSNVFYGGLDVGLREHLRGVIDGVTHYPEAGGHSLQAAAAAAYGVEPGSVLVTNGATEAIYLIAQAFRGCHATIVGPTFAEYADACRIQEMEVSQLSWEELATGRAVKGLVFICNPNNPTGRALAVKDVLAVVDRWPEALFVPVEALLTATGEWRRELAAATGWRVWDTDTHYFLFEGPPGLKERLVTRYGLLVRDAGNFVGLEPNHFRVACQGFEQNKLLTEALRECSRIGG